jgi:hypothetical protein
MLDTVVIKGKGLTTGHEYKKFLIQHPRAELWTLNDDIQVETVVHFDMHNPAHHRDVLDCAYRMPAKFMKFKKAVIAHNATPTGVNDVQFPLADLKKMLKTQTVTINCAPAFMIAYAIMLGAKRICTAGIDFIHTEEIRNGQLQCVEEWLNLAKSLGIEHKNTRRSLLFTGRGLTLSDNSYKTILTKEFVYC